MEIINLKEKSKLLKGFWQPALITEVNDHSVKIAKVLGEFVRHTHENEDELFYVLSGKLFIEFDEETIEINEGEMIKIPKGVAHKPFSEIETLIVLFEPNSTVNTGDVRNNLTHINIDKI